MPKHEFVQLLFRSQRVFGNSENGMDTLVIRSSRWFARNCLWKWGVGCVALMLMCGCQQWPGTQAMRQYQLESDRLLSEFRSQKKRAEELEQRNQQLEQRLGESERLIAKLQGRSSSRVADNRNKPIPPNDRTLADIGGANNGTSPRRLPGPGLPDAAPSTGTPGTPGRLTSGGYNGGEDLKGDPSRPNQWRPISGR
ncbi:MAG: DUF3450 domain-containing protein [Pirellula sp.]|nr:DUF3450 domain-containing protein [Pirellula sp.]